ncbi:MAG: hypothetical protein HZA66_13240 [Rhodopseudomonas palustris]|uniref:Uncharacterized protein n=1 Tax=Rhodopseudomonas palustris TaxID=1076 RepID=A0A933W1E4_RHOPL|nr:hypothetical protein [Rhodopseudomonas palustris]
MSRTATKRPAKPPPAKREAATSTVEKAAVKKTAAKTSAGKARATKTSAAKSDRPRIAKTSVAKTSVAKATVAETVEEPAVAQTAPILDITDHDDGESPSTPRRRGPSGVTRTAVDRCNDPPPLSGLPLIDRVGQAAEREILQIEVIVGGNRVKPEQRTEAERRARTLASLARTLAALRQLRSDEQRRRSRDDDAIPRDLDELRRALSRRLEQMVDGRAQLPAAGDE